MITIDWDEYKEYKRYSVRDDNFEVLLDFIKSYYSVTHPSDMYETLNGDATAKMMLEKRKLKDAEDLEIFLRKY